MSELQGGAVTPGGRQPVPLLVVALTAAAAGAIGVSMVYWQTHKRRDLSGPTSSVLDSRKPTAGGRRFITWPWSKPTSLTSIAAAAAAERLSALARSSEAIESAAQIPLDKTSSLASLASGRQQSGGDSEAAAPARAFGEADLSGLVYCTRRNGAREVLGAGTAGQVYKALRDGKHPIAVREFRYALSEDELSQLRDLISKLQGCADKNVVKLQGWAPIPGPGGGLLIAAPFFEGGTLQDVLDGPHSEGLRWRRLGKPQQLGAARKVALAVARGLDWLHKRGIVHQNLRPKKVLLGEGGEARLGDAGMAPFTHPDYMAAKSNCGQFSWAAPDLMKGKPASAKTDIYSFGILLWQLLTGNDPVTERRRLVKAGPETCPQAISDLLVQCLDRNPDARPSAGEIVALLSRPASQLPPALRPRPGNFPCAGCPITGGKLVVWRALQDWVYRSFGSKEKAHAAGYVESIPDKILDAREWDAYEQYYLSLKWALSHHDVEVPNTAAYNRLLEMHTCYGWAVYSKLSMTNAVVRERRFAQMETLESLDALLTPEEESSSHGAASDSVRRMSGNSKGSGRAGRDSAPSDHTSEGSLGSDGSDSMMKRYLKRLKIIDLTKDQLDATLWAYEKFRAAQQDLVKERNAMVRILHDFAVGAISDHDQALQASTTLRSNIMEEVELAACSDLCCLWPATVQHALLVIRFDRMWELLSPWQNASSETDAYPYLSDPMLLIQLAVAKAKGDKGTVSDPSWMPMMNEGQFSELKCDLNLIIRNDK